MEPTITAALIVAAATVIAAVIARSGADHRLLQRIRPERRKALNGRWEGTFLQETPEEFTGSAMDIVFNFETRRKKIVGDAEYKPLNRDEYHRVVVRGAFYNDSFLRLEYDSDSRKVVHFGLFLLELSAAADELTGRFLGYGRISQVPVTGTITVRKK